MESPNNKESTKKQGKEEQQKPYSNIKRMLTALDKFLNKRIMGIGIFYLCALIAFGTVLIVNGVISNASSGGGEGGISKTYIWLFSALGVITFIFILIIARVISVRIIARKKHVNMSEKIEIANTNG